MTEAELEKRTKGNADQLTLLTDPKTLAKYSGKVIKAKSRKYLNSIAEDIKAYSSTIENYTEYVDSYNAELATINKRLPKDLRISLLETPSKFEVNGYTVKKVIRSVSQNMDVAKGIIEKKIDYLGKLGSLSKMKSVPSLFKIPRVTLLQSGLYVDGTKRKKAFKFPVKYESQFQRTIDLGIRAGLSGDKLSTILVSKLNKVLPSDSFYFKRGKGFYKMSINNYVKMWVRDFHTILHSDGVIASATISGSKYLKVLPSDRASTDVLCARYAGGVFRIGSSGKKSYPVLTQSPPYHPNCKHYLTIYTESTSSLIASIQELKQQTNASIQASIQQNIKRFSSGK